MKPLDKKKILLIQPLGYRASAASGDISRLTSIIPPIGILSMASYLGQKGLWAGLLDCYQRPDSDRLIKDLLSAERPAFLGISSTTSNFLDGVRIAGLAKGVLPGIKTVFGGAHVSALKGMALERFPEADFVAVGEGEETVFELMEGGFESPESVPGLAYRADGGEVRFNGYRAKGLELDSLPFPAYEKLHGFPGDYRLPIFNYPKAPNSSLISSRGCPYSCSYCDRSVFGRSFRFNSAIYMYEHMRRLGEGFGVRHVTFYDDQFTFNRKRVEDFARMLVDRPLGMSFNCVVRAEHVDFDLLRLLKEAGCWMISLGIESGDEGLLAEHRRNSNLGMMAEKIHMVKRAGIRTKGLLMIGLPGETEESVQKSMKYVFSLPIDDFNLAKFTPFPGSPLYERIHELGSFDEDWEKMDCMHFQFVPNGMTKEKLERLFTEFYRAHFRRPSVIAGYASMLWRSPDSWLRFLRNAVYFLKFARTDRRLGV